MTISITIGKAIWMSISGVQSLRPSKINIISAKTVIWYEFALFRAFVSRKPSVLKMTPSTSAQMAPEIPVQEPISIAAQATMPNFVRIRIGEFQRSGIVRMP